MKLDEYQARAREFALYHNHDSEDIALYPFLALSEETGEVNGKLAKSLRGDKELENYDVAKELGDVLWNLSECARQVGWRLSDIAELNIIKLEVRKEANKIKGDGDDR